MNYLALTLSLLVSIVVTNASAQEGGWFPADQSLLSYRNSDYLVTFGFIAYDANDHFSPTDPPMLFSAIFRSHKEKEAISKYLKLQTNGVVPKIFTFKVFHSKAFYNSSYEFVLDPLAGFGDLAAEGCDATAESLNYLASTESKGPPLIPHTLINPDGSKTKTHVPQFCPWNAIPFLVSEIVNGKPVPVWKVKF